MPSIKIKKLQIEILKKHAGPFIFCFLIVMFLLLMQFLILHIDNLVGKGIPTLIIFELIIVNLAYMVVLAVPMSVLVSCIMAFGKFSELNELTAIKAAGISVLTIIKPVLFIGALLTVFLIWFSNEVLPEANFKARSLFIDIRMQSPGFDLRPNVFYDGIDGYNFLVREIDTTTDSLYNVTLFDEGRNQQTGAVIKANRGFLESVEGTHVLSLYLYDGQINRDIASNTDDKKRYETTYFSTYRINFDLSDLNFNRSDPDRRRRDDRTMSSQAMLAVVDTLRKEAADDQRRLTRNIATNALITAFSSDTTTVKAELTQRDRSQIRNFEILEQTRNQVNSLDTLQSIIPLVSGFHALNHFPDRDQQIHLKSAATTQFRENISQLNNLNNNLRFRTERIAQYLVEVHKKISIPVACIIFVLVGAPLGLLTRKGNLGFNAILSSIIFTYYWVGIIQGEKFADRLFISPFTGMWFTNFTLLILGIYLMLKVMYEFKLSDLWRAKSE